MEEAATIWIVSDASPLREAVERAAASDDVRVTSHGVADLAEASEAELTHVALLILDATRGQDVTPLIRSLISRRGSVSPRILALTPVDRPDIVDAVMGAGASDFVLQPAHEAELRARVRHHLALHAGALQRLDRERAMQATLELTQTLVSSLDPREILHTIVQRAAEVTGVSRVSIVVVPEDSGSGYVVAASDDTHIRDLPIQLARYPEIRSVLATRKPLTIADVATHPVLDGVRGEVVRSGTAALTLIPIVEDQRALGVLVVRSGTSKGALADERLGFCRILANAGAVALRNARLVHDLRARSRAGDSARRQAEQRARRLERYADLFTSSVDGIAVHDMDGRVLFANPGAYTILRRDSQALYGTPLWDLAVEADRALVQQLWEGFRRGEYPRNVDLRIATPDGAAVDINASFSPLSGQEGTVLVSFRDVTEHRRTETEILKTKTFLESLIDASVDAIVASDLQGTIILFNRGAERIYGRRAHDVVGKLHVKHLYPEGGAHEVGRMLRSAKHGGFGRLEPVRIEALDAHGYTFPISLTAAMIHENGKPIATFGIFTDLRDRVRVEQQLAQAQEQLAVSEKQALIAELAGAAAHELNQPLTSIMGYTELLKRRVGPDAGLNRALEVVSKESERMAEIVRKIGKLTKYETKTYVGGQRILDLDRGVEGDADDEDQHAGEHG